MAPAGIRAHFDIAILNVAERPFANTSGVGDLLLGRELLALLPDCFYLRAVDNKSFHTRSPRLAIPRSLFTPPLAPKIGRASWRESVCEYGYISGVAG